MTAVHWALELLEELGQMLRAAGLAEVCVYMEAPVACVTGHNRSRLYVGPAKVHCVFAYGGAVAAYVECGHGRGHRPMPGATSRRGLARTSSPGPSTVSARRPRRSGP